MSTPPEHITTTTTTTFPELIRWFIITPKAWVLLFTALSLFLILLLGSAKLAGINIQKIINGYSDNEKNQLSEDVARILANSYKNDLKGERGARGDRGDRGEQGAQGERGEQGAQGAQGERGG